MFVLDIINPNYTEESSDYVNSDIEISSSCITKTNIGDDSNDSLAFERDNDSSSNMSFLHIGDKRLKTNKSSQKQVDRVRLAECLDYLHRMIGRKDKEDIFGHPVTDDIAPGYSSIIKSPMDLSTMRKKIDSHDYDSIVEYRVINLILKFFLNLY